MSTTSARLHSYTVRVPTSLGDSSSLNFFPIMSSIAPSLTSMSGRDWTREVCRSAPARLAKNALLSPVGGALPVVEVPRQRYEVSTQVQRKNDEFTDLQLASAANKGRGRRKQSK